MKDNQNKEETKQVERTQKNVCRFCGEKVFDYCYKDHTNCVQNALADFLIERNK